MKVSKTYLGGGHGEKQAVRKYQFTISGGKHDGETFFSEVVTTRKNADSEWREGTTWYYWNENSPMYKSLEKLIANPIKKKE